MKEDLLKAEIAQDEAYLNEVTRIEGERLDRIVQINREAAKEAEENVFTVLERDARRFANMSDTLFNEQLKEISSRYLSGELRNVEEFNRLRSEAEYNARQTSLKNELKYLSDRLTLVKQGSTEYTEILRQASEVEAQIQQEAADRAIELENMRQQQIMELRQGAIDATLNLISSLNEAEDVKREEQLESIQANMEAQLRMAGDNEEAKAIIRNRAEAEQQKIRLQQVAADRKRAIFEKATAALSVGINTAKGIGQALGNFPPPVSFVFAAAVAALGAIQLAAILAKPIPQYAEGTDNHPGGLAVVGEEGIERGILPSGQHFLTPGHATLMDLPARTKIETHEETMRGLAAGSLRKTDTLGTKQDVEHFEKLGREIRNLTKVVKNKPTPQMNWTKQGLERVIQNGESRTKWLNEFCK